MDKKQAKKKNTSSKKKKIIIGTVCGILAAGALAAGLGIGLTQCGPTEPKNKFTIYFTPAPGDATVQINTTSKTIQAGKTFADAKQGVTATKHDDLGDWHFQWWYKDGDEPTNEIENDLVLGNDPYVKTLTVHPYFTPPSVTHTVVFSNNGDPNIQFNVTQLEYEVKDGSTLEELLKQSKIEATKNVEGKEWTFKYWTTNLQVEHEWQKPRDYGIPNPIVDSITLYPYFEEPEEEWISKKITWETYLTPDPIEVSKEFVLPPESESTTTFKTTISNFVLSYDDTTIQKIPELQEGEKIIVFPVPTTEAEIYKGVNIRGSVLPPAQDTEPNKLNVEFTFNNIPTENPEVYTTPLTFDVNFGLIFGGETHEQQPISGITIHFSDPWDAPEFGFTKSSSEPVTFRTNPGSKNYYVYHDNEVNGHFTISRPLDNREKLEINVIGEDAENITVEHQVTTIENKAFIDVTISFNEITGIFVEHKANFKLEFVTTFEGSGRSDPFTIPNNFELIYTPDPRDPYSIVMDDTIVINGDLGENTISAQIENNVFPFFQGSDYLTIRNVTRENLTDPDEIDEKAPIYFTTPHEKITSEIIGESSQYALQGSDTANQNLGFKIQFLDEENIPDVITSYTIDLEFQFWVGDPGPNPESPSPEATPYTPFTREITFIFSPKKWENYTSADWAQYRSIVISMSAKNSSTGEFVQKLGTAWQLSNINGNDSYYVTAYDVKKDYETLTKDPYEGFSFGYSNMGAAKQYVERDSTKYIMVDDNINDDHLGLLTTDLLTSNHIVEETGEMGVDWVDEDSGDTGNLYWDMSQYGYNDLYAPNLALFKLNPEEHAGLDYDSTLYDQTFRFRPAILNSWAKEEGLDPLHEKSEAGGQVSKLFETIPDDFSRNGFSYGYTGGFKSKEVSLGSGTDKKTARLVYWTDYVMYAQIGQLAYLNPNMYNNCEGYYDPMFMVRDPQEQVYHVCGAFAMTLSSFSRSSYYDDAGRGAMMLLRKYAPDGKSLESPVIAGINWNGGSNWNWPGNITPYFDVWQYGSQQQNNLLAPYKNPWR